MGGLFEHRPPGVYWEAKMNTRQTTTLCLVLTLGILLIACYQQPEPPPPLPARGIEIFGAAEDRTNWHLRIDGVDQPESNPLEIPVGPGDTITWSVEGGSHGVVFESEAKAVSLLSFQPVVVERPLTPEEISELRFLADRPDFGAGWWGTTAFENGILAQATVREDVISGQIQFTCIRHGTPDIASGQMRGVLIVAQE